MELIEIIGLIVPLLSLILLIFFVLHNKKHTQLPQPLTINNSSQESKNDSKTEISKIIMPSRIDAYQRLVLFMERISPNSMVMRKFTNHKSAQQLQQDLLSTIRSEFEHNIAQQVFVSPQGWKMVKDSKEQIIQIINLAADKAGENATTIELSAKIFELSAEFEKLPTEITSEFLVAELQQLF
jgi:hypothetical protein